MDDTMAYATRGAAALFPSPPKIVDHMEWRLGFFYTQTADVGAFLRGALETPALRGRHVSNET